MIIYNCIGGCGGIMKRKHIKPTPTRRNAHHEAANLRKAGRHDAGRLRPRRTRGDAQRRAIQESQA